MVVTLATVETYMLFLTIFSCMAFLLKHEPLNFSFLAFCVVYLGIHLTNGFDYKKCISHPFETLSYSLNYYHLLQIVLLQ